MELSWLVNPPDDLTDRIMDTMWALDRNVTLARATLDKRRNAAETARNALQRKASAELELTEEDILAVEPRTATLDIFRREALHKHLPLFLAHVANRHYRRSWTMRTVLEAGLYRLSEDIKCMHFAIEDCRSRGTKSPMPEALALGQLSVRRRRPLRSSSWTSGVRGSGPMLIAREMHDGLSDLKDILHHAQSHLRYGLAPLFDNVATIQLKLEKWSPEFESGELARPLHLASVDRYESIKQATKPLPNRATKSAPVVLFEFIAERLESLGEQVEHLRRLIRQFGRSNETDTDKWITQGSSPLAQSARFELVPFFQKGEGPDPLTWLIQQIADLYGSVFDEPFGINRSNSAGSKIRAFQFKEEIKPTSLHRLGVLRYKVGKPMLFAYALITSLELDALVIPFDEVELGFNDGDLPTFYELRQHNREFGLGHARRRVHSHRDVSDRPLLDTDLIDAIGRAWQRIAKPE